MIKAYCTRFSMIAFGTMSIMVCLTMAKYDEMRISVIQEPVSAWVSGRWIQHQKALAQEGMMGITH